MDVIQAYKLTPFGNGKPFYAAIVDMGLPGPVALTNRLGYWARDDQIHFADLMMPQFKLYEWDVDKIPTSELPKGLLNPMDESNEHGNG